MLSAVQTMRFIAIVTGLSVLGIARAEVQVDAVRIAESEGRTRVVLDLSQPGQHKVFGLSNPQRVVVDLPGAHLKSLRTLPSGKGAIAGVRGSNRDDGSARLVFDMTTTVATTSFLLEPGAGRGHRLVIDMASGTPEQVMKSVRVIKSVEPIAKQERDIVIAVDAGHGGKDPGARGRKGTREKDVVLAIAKKLAKEIDAEPGMKAVLIRKDDRFISLRGRIQKAHKYEADLFVSIHADAFKDRRVRGSTVYVLSQKGASDEHARRLAKRENDADLLGDVSLKDKDETLASVLLDLSQNAAIGSSFDAGQEIVNEMHRVGRVRKTTVQQAPFLVLKSPDIPSILIETAYISNPTDEKNLASRRHQQKMAAAIFDGIQDYFYSNPPVGTKVARLAREAASERQYTIQRGDTLSEIADRYNVTVRNIRDVNKIRGDKIRVGQTLRIPSSTRT